MAASGAKVLQLRSVEFARNHGVMVHVRSTFTDEPGTWIREEDERMLEKALISGVTHTVEEAVYEVDGVRPADLFEALAAAEVNVDTIIQMDSRIVFSAPVEDRPQAEQALDGLRAALLGAARPRQGERGRRRDEEPPGRRRPHVRDARASSASSRSSWPPRRSRSRSTSRRTRSSRPCARSTRSSTSAPPQAERQHHA